MMLRVVSLAFFASAVAVAQPSGSVPAERPKARPPSALKGWADWEKGEELLKRIQVPPAPVLSAEEEAKSFKLARGFSVQLVACEPMVQCPIFFEFDPGGRIWVVEYQGYMRDIQGSGEGDPICRLVVLEDENGDGLADKSTVYLDKLVMPRSFAFVKGGILLQEPPRLWFCEDTDGDLKCDKRTEVGTMGIAGNPQHTANGLRYGIDNWLHCADWPQRYQWKDGKLISEPVPHRGQFGVSFDETGRFISCYENSAMHMDLLPAEAIARNPQLAALVRKAGRSGLGVNVNVAKQGQEVFPIRVTPAVTLGGLELRDDGRLRTYTIVSGTCFNDGDQFPDAMRGSVFVPDSAGHLVGTLKLTEGIQPAATRWFPAEQELIASTDERFRPVNARMGPDGALYLADMYHGIIEHVIFMVPWLTKQIEERKLHEGNDRGRIWRIVHDGKTLRSRPNMSAATNEQLEQTLNHDNGWHRLTAQRLLVERDHAPSLNQPTPLGRLHALWARHGLGKLTPAELADDPDPRVRAAVARWLPSLIHDPDEQVQLHAALALNGDIKAATACLLKHDNDLFRVAVLTSFAGKEVELLKSLITAKAPETTLRFVAGLIEAASAPPPAPKKPRRELTAAQQKRFDRGSTLYQTTCGLCHMINGYGVPNLAPPLSESPWATGDPSVLIRIALQGVHGPIQVGDQTWNLVMPGQADNPTLDDTALADVLSYVRNAFGNQASFVEPEQVTQTRSATKDRHLPWSVDELTKTATSR